MVLLERFELAYAFRKILFFMASASDMSSDVYHHCVYSCKNTYGWT